MGWVDRVGHWGWLIGMEMRDGGYDGYFEDCIVRR
jgi:hypothetical protein